MKDREVACVAEESQGELKPIGVVARETGLTPRAIRYYEEMGLLRPAVRVKGADRLFDASDIQRLHEIKRLREVIGFSLAEIRELLETDDLRAQLRDQFARTSDPMDRIRALRQAIDLAERRLAIISRKLAQIETIRVEEQARLARLQALLAHELDRQPDPSGSSAAVSAPSSTTTGRS
ncbi:MAG: MerR family transcriptional regulator [Chloroflexi bacterium]|nr:MerR family transcriptional regulator [Chloroflexota bacterium]HLG51948.1 MerR family transcriptional regulator [Chloroflexota bacterium]